MVNPEFRKQLSVETLVAEASELIARLMAKENLSKADLARRLNRSRAWVTQLLSGRTNITIRTLAEVSFALGAEVKLREQRPPGTSASAQTPEQSEIAREPKARERSSRNVV
jgi:transcriptional regulator with XRE-family HTH domain